MNDMIAWLLDLNSLSWGDEGVRLGFERPLPIWAWPGVLGAAFLFAFWSYRHLVGSRAGRIGLGVLRGLLLVTLVVLIAGPRLVRTDETVEQDWVLVLVDRSASMTIEDAGDEDIAISDRISRDEQLREAVGESWPTWLDLAEERTVVWLGFDAGAYELEISGEGTGAAIDFGEPTGRRTSLATALEQALRRAAARPLSGIIILSDGRSIDEPAKAVMRRLRAEATPVLVVPLGSEDPVGDLAVRRVEGPGMAFVNDVAPITVELERLGAADGIGGTVRLIDKGTGLTLDERRIEPGAMGGAGDRFVTLTHRPQQAGVSTWIVELDPDGPDLIEGNNSAEVSIELVDRPLRTLYLDGYPRWEHRYLKNLLIREGSVLSSNLLLSPSRRPSQEGDVEIDALPDSPEQWAEFDVVILGDVSPEVFTEAQLEDLREHVAVRGGGLLWIGGPGSTPDSWWAEPLGDLLPFTRDAIAPEGIATGSLVQPTPLAERFGVLRLADVADDPWPAELADPATGWSVLRWTQPIRASGVKPTAEALALAIPENGDNLTDADPLILTMRYGAGRIIYVATDEIWRWRYGRGEKLFERFWLQLIRLLARESLSRTGQSATLTLSPHRPMVDQPVRVAVELMDQSLVELGLASVQVELRRQRAPGEQDEPAPIMLTLGREDSQGRNFAATWLPTETGVWEAQATDSALLGLDLAAEAIVSAPDDELRRPETDHALLASLAEETGGRVINVADLGSIAQYLPNRQLRLVSETDEPLWDTPLALILLIVLLTGEWVGRRLLSLV